jgi:hypothetical protein
MTASVLTAILTLGLTSPLATAQTTRSRLLAYCQASVEAIAQKDALLQLALQGDDRAERQYKQLLTDHAESVERCRSQNWPQDQAIWIRLYPCDLQPGKLEAALDRIVNRGYNKVYVEVFYNGQVLLPVNENRTPWPSVVRNPGYEDRDLLAEAITKGRERGLKVYAWMFTLNFGYSYSQRPGADQVLARNGRGNTSLSIGDGYEEIFVDPYNPQAKQDYYWLVEAIARRRPDGMLFDYIRYPKGVGSATVASNVRDLWIYSPAAQQALLQRALNQSGQELIYRFLNQGHITAGDIQTVLSRYGNQGEPMWQGRSPAVSIAATTAEQARPSLQTELWQLSVAHAIQGVLDFLNLALQPVQRQGIAAGAVFFPDANRTVGTGGYDARLQPWDRFPTNIEWHPMAYANCGNTGCITPQVQRVIDQAPAGVRVIPALAGAWGQTLSDHPPLEAQMQSLRSAVPQINAVSHFAYSWQEPQSDQERKFCHL